VKTSTGSGNAFVKVLYCRKDENLLSVKL